MRAATLKFLRAQKERLEREADLIRSGARKILRVMDGETEDISVEWLRQADQQIDEFEEIIAAVESRLQ